MKSRKGLYIAAFALIALSWLTAAAFLIASPDVVPVHYDMNWQVDRYGSKFEYLIFPSAITLMGGIILAVGCFCRRAGQRVGEIAALWTAVSMMLPCNIMFIVFVCKELF